MTTEKEAVSNMIQQIRDRLDDVEESLDLFEGNLSGYVKRFDRIDDQLFAIEEEFEAVPEVEKALDESEADGSGDGGDPVGKKVAKKTQSDEDDDEYVPLVTKEAVASATSDANVIFKEGKATVVELAEAFSDIKSALDFKSLLK